jgi:RNA-binding protein YhbY
LKKFRVKIQIGKNGLTPGIIETLENAFKSREDVKIHVLKSAGHTRKNIKDMADKIIGRLGGKYTYKIIGFTIFIKKWRKAKR